MGERQLVDDRQQHSQVCGKLNALKEGVYLA